ncbi:Alpha/Beta hydrolase protein [Microdochium trichocladiopsis]|uniref:Alpha/Beta hydrolase protein n=1 Tax=Microdochium trichocladiopsis TaxID=1682393 RepID=A0A9P9BR89_9PEZI|nr:Alpha/Beta hydrolase protein [Microdochium trichocladiopsis]KAH7026652.1 Alpha/Beta hydrolase protein [Microdochium trichocladiopsis]
MSTTVAPAAFGESYIIEPASTAKHTHTIILLHGRGSDGEEFAGEFFDSLANDDEQVNTATANAFFPNFRWVFPSSPSQWDSTFKEYMSAWFEAPSLADLPLGYNIQAQGIRGAVARVQNVLDDEIARLGGQSEKLFLGGISQGGAIAMITLLARRTKKQPHDSSGSDRLAGLIVASTWLPVAADIDEYWAADASAKDIVASSSDRGNTITATPVFFGHGVDDAYVDIQLGREACRTFSTIGFENIEWKEYSGAEQEGHWLQVPNEVNDIATFVRKHMC